MKIDDDTNLAVELKKYMDALPEDSEKTIDDFYDHVGLEQEYRTGFGTAALFKQYYELVEEDKKHDI